MQRLRTVNGIIYPASRVKFGTWNGSNVTGTLVDPYGNPISSASVSAIHRTDWQGRQLLYPTPRVNYVGGAQVGEPGWGTDSNTTVTLNAAVGPDGTTTATQIVTSSSGAGGVYVFPHSVWSAVPNPPNGLVTESVWLKLVSGSAVVTVGCDQGGISPKPFTLTTAWQRYPVTFDWTSASNIDLAIGMGAATTILAAYAQIEASPMATAFYNPGTGLVTPITDYTLNGTTVNLAQAPASTDTTDWDGVYV